MIPESVANKYSQAMFDIACEQEKLEEIGSDLRSVRDTLRMNPDLRKFINHPLIPTQSKKDTMHQIFADSVAPVVLQFLYVMIDRHREPVIEAAVDGFIDLARSARNIEVAKIRVVHPLSAAEEQKLMAGLETLTGKRIDPSYIVDPSIIGGIVIQIGDRLIDGSLLRQLQDLEHVLLQAEVTNEVTDAK
jgi:F-type H+-transporting ATPase subunit delta